MSHTWVPAKSVLDSGEHGISLTDLKEETVAIASTLQHVERKEKPLVTPIYHSSAYKFQSVEDYLDVVQNGGYIYSRLGNPSQDAAACTLNNLEGGAGAICVSSGMAAITTALLGVLRAGDHVICCNPCYSGMHRFLTKNLPAFNIEYTWVPAGCSVEEYKKKVKPNTRVIYGETPCNPLISILDVEEFAKLGQSLGKDVYTMIDATYATPCCLQPLKYGIDIVVHSATKYMGGHTDLIAGVIVTKTLEMWQNLNVLKTELGNSLSPFDCTLLTRGLRTMPLRVERHCSNAQSLAEYLDKNPKVSTVYYPGLPSHPGHAVAKKQMKRFGGMIAFEMKDGLEAARTVVEGVNLMQLAVSLGGVETLIEHAASMTHGPMIMTDKEREEALITPGLIRLSVGLEHIDDLIKDLQQALDKA